MKRYNLLVWKAVDKFDNPSRLIYGERLVVEVFVPSGRRNHRLRLIRQFRSYFEWRDVDENGQFDVTITCSVLDKLINILKEARRGIYGEKS